MYRHAWDVSTTFGGTTKDGQHLFVKCYLPDDFLEMVGYSDRFYHACAGYESCREEASFGKSGGYGRARLPT